MMRRLRIDDEGERRLSDILNASMLRYLIRRLLLTIPVLLGVATLVFALIHLVPGDPAQSMLGEGASAEEVAEAAARRSASIGRCSRSTARSSTGSSRAISGTSFRYGTPVTREIRDAAVPTPLQLAVAAMVVAILFARPARHPRARSSAARPSTTPR